MEQPEPFIGINRESSIAKAQDWAKINNLFIKRMEAYPEDEDKINAWWHCVIQVCEKPDEHIIEGITLDNINAV